METLRKIYVTLGLDWDSAGFAAALNASSALEGAAKALVSVFQELAAVITSSIAETTEYGSTFNDAALRTGAATTALQEYAYAAKLAGVEQGTVFSALTRLSHTMGQAAAGSKEAAAGFAALGVRVTDSNGKLRRSDEVFDDLVAKLGNLKNPTDRASRALQIFGRQGTELLPLFAEGSAGLEQMRAQFRGLGIGLSEDGVSAADRFGDSLDTLRAVLDSFKRDLGEPLLRALQPAIDATLAWVAANRELIRSKINSFAQALIKTVTLVWKVLVKFNESLAVIIATLKTLALLVGSFVVAKFVILNATLLETLVAWALNTTAAGLYGATMVAAAAKAALAWLAAAAPVILLTAALLVAALAAEDVYQYLTGGDSVLGELGPKWTKFIDEWTKPHKGDSTLMEGLRALLRGLTDIEGVALPALKEAWADMWSYAKNVARGFFLDVQIMIGNLRDSVRNLFNTKALLRSLPVVSSALAVGDAIDAFSGGAASPQAAATSSAAAMPRPLVLAPNFQAEISVVAPPGQNAESVGVLLEQRLDTWWDGKMREATETAGE